MKHITIIIPTRNRFEKLQKCLNSIPKVDWIHTYVVCDDDNVTFTNLHASEYLTIFRSNEHIGSVACRNMVTPLVKDGLIYLTDDMWFLGSFDFETLIKAFNITFPDDDGVVGIRQNLSDYHPTGVALVGQKFLQRYPEKKLFFPGYYTFACQEVAALAKKVNKFVETLGTWKVNHDHPAFNPELIDETHKDARKFKKEDMRLIKERQEKGLIWGDDEIL